MLTGMAEKIRLVLVVDEEIRAALRFEAGKRSAARVDGTEVTMAEVMEELVRKGLADSLEAVRKARAVEKKKNDK
jgi:hypothetical protein